MEQHKWEKVGGGKRASSGGKGASAAAREATGKTTGLSHSSTPFSQFSEKLQDEEEPVEEIEAAFSSTTVVLDHPSLPLTQSIGKKKSAGKKTKHHPKVKKQPFDQCLFELLPQEVEKLAEEIKTKYEDKPMNILKEVHGFLGTVFSKAEPEKDYVFSTQPPGYPLTALPDKSKEILLKLVVQCPPLTQEKAFSYFFELLLGEIGAGAASYGTRMMLLLLVQCNSSVCIETGTMIKIFLESNISKVPEALSLLWVGMPHPSLHPTTAVQTWPELCVPLFQRPNIPRQVISYAVDYSCALIRCVGDKNAVLLLDALTPNTLSSLLASSHLQKRAQDNVQEMLELAQRAVLRATADKKLSKYFTATFKQVSLENPVAVKFAAGCLLKSGSSWEAWSGLGPASPASSAALLKELSEQDLTVPGISVDRLASVLTKVSQKLPEKDKELAKELLSDYAQLYERQAAEEVRKERGVQTGVRGREEPQGAWCSGCGLLVMFLSVMYLVAMGYFLYHIATEGPQATLDTLSAYVGVRDVQFAWRSTAVLLNRYCEMLLEYVPQLAQTPDKLGQYFSTLTS